MRRLGIAVALGGVAVGCGVDPVIVVGQFGRPIPLATGDDSPLPRLAFVDEGCPGDDVAVGGCAASGERACMPLLIDSLAPISALRDPDAEQGRVDIECLEARAAGGLAEPDPSDDALADAVARFRFSNLAVIRASEAGSDDWAWTAGDAQHTIEPGGVLGGNLLRGLAVELRTPRAPNAGPPTIALYGEFPGSERDLADQGRAFIPLQFPGRLLGRDLGDRCDVDGDRCRVPGYDLRPGQNEIALQATRMVLDACIAPPPCTVTYERDRLDPFRAGECDQALGPGSDARCFAADDDDGGGLSASLVVASGVPGLVLFSDSAERLFGAPGELPTCHPSSIDDTTRACLTGNAGQLHVSGWPSAGSPPDAGLPQLRVRSLGLIPGSVETRDVTPCTRMQRRRDALLDSCDRFVEAAGEAGDVRNTSPPFSAEADGSDGEGHDDDPGATSLVVLGEATLPLGAPGPNPEQWIEVTVLPAEHSLVLALRRDVTPEAIEPDGLLGTILFDDTVAVLDYTDTNPGVRVACLDPRSGDCFVAPDCREDAQPACCHGLPLELIVDFILVGEDDTCCGALSASELLEVQALGRCTRTAPR